MAEKKKAEAEVEAPEGEAAAKPKKKGKLLIILIALALLGGGGGGAAWWFMKGKKPQDPKATASQKKDEPEKPPIYIRLEPLPVNLKKVDAEDHLLQIEIQFKVEEPKAEAAVKLRIPEIKNALILLLSNQTKADLATVEGKQKLSSDIVSQVNQIIRAKEPAKDGVVGVYFTSFVMQ
ncbi:MAG: flagellar basal body-associated protein FliL [Pseudomonadota bacterium]